MNQDSNLRVFVIWEPVIVTDWGTPGNTITALVADPRASHFWDRELRLSALYGNTSRLDTLAAKSHVDFNMGDVVWDAALVYPPGVRWGSPAKVIVAPVVDYPDELKGALAP